MAATWIKPLHVNKGKTIAQTITDRTDYAENPDKTKKGELVTGYQCSPHTVDAEFLLAKRQYQHITGRNQGSKDILAFHIRQSFKPGEITSELANKLGYELAMRFTRGHHAFIVATHVDRKHIHSHIVFNSTNLDCTGKFQNPLRSNKIIRRISDHLCIENGLSIIKNPKPSRDHYGTWLGDKKEPSWREKLEALIDDVLSKQPPDFDAFFKDLEAAKCEVKRGKHISLRLEGQRRFIRLQSLSEDYSEAAIRKRIFGIRTVTPRNAVEQYRQMAQPNKVNLLIDIQNSIKAQNSPGYERWAKIFNLKQAAQTLIFLQEHDITEMEKLYQKAQQAKDDFNNLSTRIQTLDSRLKDITALQKHIGIYSKTSEIYTGYRKAGYSKKYLAEHEDSINAHKAAKKCFDSLGLQKLPTIKSLQTEYAAISAVKKKLYDAYHPARKYMQDILTAKQNAEQLLNYRETEKNKESVRT